MYGGCQHMAVLLVICHLLDQRFEAFNPGIRKVLAQLGFEMRNSFWSDAEFTLQGAPYFGHDFGRPEWPIVRSAFCQTQQSISDRCLNQQVGVDDCGREGLLELTSIRRVLP